MHDVKDKRFLSEALPPKLVNLLLSKTDISLYLLSAIKLTSTPITCAHNICMDRTMYSLSLWK